MPRVSNEEKAKKLKIKSKAQLIALNLNRLEEIFQSYTISDVKEEKLTEVAMLIGKVMSNFSDLSQELGVFDE